MEAIKGLKKSKRELKSTITRALNDLAIRLAAKEPDCTQISASLEHIEEKKEEALACMRDLEIEFHKIKKTEDAEKVGDEADALVERVDKETNPARSFLATQVKSSSSKQKESTEIEEYTNAQQGASDPNKQLDYALEYRYFRETKWSSNSGSPPFPLASIKRHLRHNSKC